MPNTTRERVFNWINIEKPKITKVTFGVKKITAKKGNEFMKNLITQLVV